MQDCIYRISEAEVWARAQAEGVLPRSDLDRRDGYIHLCSADQLGRTLERYFGGRADLVVLTVSTERLTEGTLRYELPAWAGADSAAARVEQFPHYYGRIPLSAIVAATSLELEADGSHQLPPEIRAAAALERDNLDGISIRVAWDEREQIAFMEYPKPTRIEDEAGIYAWEALLEARLSEFVEGHGGKVPVVIGLDNLWVAPSLERRYAELADKIVTRYFSDVARWSAQTRQRGFFVRTFAARSQPPHVFDTREQAVGSILARLDGVVLGSGHVRAPLANSSTCGGETEYPPRE